MKKMKKYEKISGGRRGGRRGNERQSGLLLIGDLSCAAEVPNFVKLTLLDKLLQ